MANNHSYEPGLFSLCVITVFKWMGCMLLGWFLLVLASSISTAFLPHQFVLEYSKQLLHSNMAYINQAAHGSWLLKHPATVNESMNEAIQYLLWVKTHLANGIAWLTTQSTTNNTVVKQTIQKFLPFLIYYLQLLTTTTQLAATRLFTLFLVLPLFWLLGLIGFIDGLVQRTLRRLQGSRESALIYHKVRNAIVPSFIGGCFLYLILPFNVPIAMLLLPCAIACSVFLSITVRMFKKYL